MAIRTEYTRPGGVLQRGEMAVPEGDGSFKTLLEQMDLILGEAAWQYEYCKITGELMIRTGVDVQMGGDLDLLMDDDGEPIGFEVTESNLDRQDGATSWPGQRYRSELQSRHPVPVWTQDPPALEREGVQITVGQVAAAFGVDVEELSPRGLAISLKAIEDSLDDLARDLDDDYVGDKLGDASNLIQLIRQQLKGGE